jgi:hypothetical protein
LLDLFTMDKQPRERDDLSEENPALSAPDYLALVIEWDDAAALDDQTTALVSRPATGLPLRAIAASAAAVGALLFAAWGIRHLRAGHTRRLSALASG